MNRKNMVGIAGLSVVVILAGGFAFWKLTTRPDASTTTSATEAAAATTPPKPQSNEELLASWGKGPFTQLRDTDVARDLERHLVVECDVDLPAEALVALRTKVVAFLKAYSGTDFESYVAFRDAETICAAGDPRLATRTATATAALAAPAKPETGAPPEPVPTEPLRLMEVYWRAVVSVGIGPLQPGPVIEAVNWQTARARVRSLARKQLVLEEWDQYAGLESHLCKEFTASGRPLVNMVVSAPGIPNKVSVADIAARDGRLVFADIEMVYRTAEDPAHPLLLRFVWDSAAGRWLPLVALQPWGGGRKPFFW